jgi:AraC family transcriptional regulator, positive regulator of tynA and feaB
MQHQRLGAERKHTVAPTVYMSEMHGERTQVAVYSRVPDAGLKTCKLGAIELLHLRCGTVSICREVADIRPRQDRVTTFILQVKGTSAFRHYGNRFTLSEGDIALCDNSAQYQLQLEGANEIIMIRVPTAVLKRRLPTVKTLCGHVLRRDEGLASMAAAMATDLASKDMDGLDAETRARGGQYLVDVLAGSFSNLPGVQTSASAIMEGHYFRARLFVEDNLSNPDLTPSLVAARLQFSNRYLRMIFAASGEAPSAYIMRRRLEECAAQLRDPRWRSNSVTEIAFGWGFNSAAHFARSFKLRYLCSPSEFRHKPASETAQVN